MENFHEEPLEFETPILLNSQSISARSSKSYQILRKALELLLPVSLLTLVLSFSTGLSFLHSFYTYYFTTFLFPLLTQMLERKYMFLLCNGILAFLAGKSGLCAAFSSSPPHSRLHEQNETDDVQGGIMIRNDDQDIMLQQAALADPVYGEEAGTCVQTDGCTSTTTVSLKLGEQEKEALKAEEEDYMSKARAGDSKKLVEAAELIEDQEGLEEGESLAMGETDGENDLEIEGPASNTEELNKKFEEFIRKMKEELRLEAQQQQLIAA